MAEIASGKVGTVYVEVKPTVTFESAVACVMMLNLFLDDNDDYRLEVGDDGKWHITDEPLVPAMGGTCGDYTEALLGIKNPGSPQLTDEERERINGKIREYFGLECE